MATVSNLVPNAVYHVRLVATNNAGTTTGPDQAFTTPRAAAPRAPVLGKTENLRPVRGLVLILRHGTLIPLTQARQFPSGTEIDTRHGTVELVAATGKKIKKYTAKFSGAVFKTAQTRFGHNKGLTTLRLIDGRFGVPSYAVCKAGRRRVQPAKYRRRAGAIPAGAGPAAGSFSCSTQADTEAFAPEDATPPPPSAGPNGSPPTVATAR